MYLDVSALDEQYRLALMKAMDLASSGSSQIPAWPNLSKSAQAYNRVIHIPSLLFGFVCLAISSIDC